MRYRLTPLLVALVAFAGIYAAHQPDARACSAPLPYRYNVEQDNTPGCLEVMPTTGYTAEETPTLSASNSCEESAEFDKLECDTCQEEMTVAPSESNSLELVRADMEHNETLRQTYAWTLGDREGIVETTVTHQDAGEQTCDMGMAVGPAAYACAAPGGDERPLEGRSMIVAFLLFASAILLRRRG